MSDLYFAPNAGGRIDSLKLGGSLSRYAINARALLLLQELALAKRSPTWDEQMKLAHYTGWGDTEAFNAIYRERDPARDIPPQHHQRRVGVAARKYGQCPLHRSTHRGFYLARVGQHRHRPA